MKLEDMVEQIKRLSQGNNGTNIGCFIVAFDFLYFLKDEKNRERFISEYYKNDNGMFTENMKKICYYAESILLEDDIYKNMLKSIEMDVRREELVSMYNYYDTLDRIEKANNSPKNMVSDGFKIRFLKTSFDLTSDEYQNLNGRVRELKNRYDKNMIDTVAIIALFIAVSIGMVSGISFSLQAFNNFTNLNVYTMCIAVTLIGLIIYNIFYALFKFVASLCGKELDKKGNFIFVNVILVILLVFFTFLNI